MLLTRRVNNSFTTLVRSNVLDLKSKLNEKQRELDVEKSVVEKLKAENDRLVGELYRKEQILREGVKENIDVRDT